MYDIGNFVKKTFVNHDFKYTNMGDNDEILNVYTKYDEIMKAFNALFETNNENPTLMDNTDDVINTKQTQFSNEIMNCINNEIDNYTQFFIIPSDTQSVSIDKYISDIITIIRYEHNHADTKQKQTIIHALNMETIGQLKTIENFNYSHMITLLSPSAQIYMWIIRTLLFYELLLQVSEKVTEYNQQNYQLGIFGSIEATSDIDIGFTYKPEPESNLEITDNKGPLSFAINTLEDLFITRTKINSLQFDIEPYANFMTLPNGSYYLDTTNMKYEDFLELAPYVGAGILRNYIQSFIDLGYNPDVRRQKINPCESDKIKDEIVRFHKILGDTVEAPIQYNPTEGSCPNNTIHTPSIDEYTLFKSLVGPNKWSDFIHKMFGENTEDNSYQDAKETAVGLITSYLLDDYDTSRMLYYKYVLDAETYFYNEIVQSNAQGQTVPIEMMIKMLKLSSKADIFRAESYISPITVMDVVRGYQANIYDKFNREKCDNEQVSPCFIGYYGYIISILENLGYITRFRLTYCNTDPDHFDPKKCDKKYEKYIQRVNNSFVQLGLLSNLHPVETPFNFGDDWDTEIQIVTSKQPGTENDKRGMVTKSINTYLESIQTVHDSVKPQKGAGRHTRSRRPRLTKHKKRHVKKTRKRMRLSKNKRNRNK